MGAELGYPLGIHNMWTIRHQHWYLRFRRETPYERQTTWVVCPAEYKRSINVTRMLEFTPR